MEISIAQATILICFSMLTAGRRFVLSLVIPAGIGLLLQEWKAALVVLAAWGIVCLCEMFFDEIA